MIAAPLEGIAILQELIDGSEFGRTHTEESSLDLHGVVEREIVVVHHNRGASILMEFGQAADVIDVRMGADNGFDGELVAAEKAEDAFDFVAGVDHDGFMSFGIANDGAVALQHADRNFDVDHVRIGSVGCVECVGHWEKYSIEGKVEISPAWDRHGGSVENWQGWVP